MNTELDTLIDKLVSHGEDKAELDFWRSIFDSLKPEEQDKLVANLTAELKRLGEAA